VAELFSLGDFDALHRMKLTFGRFQIGHDGCFDWEIAKLESKLGVRFPSPYRRFLRRLGRDNAASSALRGSDYFVPVLFELRPWAEELLRESGSPFALHPQDFILLMHQGYQFYYFRADGANDDPPVFEYIEGGAQPEQKFRSISDWLREYGVFVA
jgi:hypothetical protein